MPLCVQPATRLPPQSQRAWFLALLLLTCGCGCACWPAGQLEFKEFRKIATKLNMMRVPEAGLLGRLMLLEQARPASIT